MTGKRVLLVVMASLAAGTGTGMTGWALRSLGGMSRAEWPPVADPAALRREAIGLCREGGGWHELQPAQYPPAMTALHPVAIHVSSERVYVELVPVSGGRTRYHGYVIWPDTGARPDGGVVRDESDEARSGW